MYTPLEREGFYIWESNLPIGIWIDKWKHKEGLEKWGVDVVAKKSKKYDLDEDEDEEGEEEVEEEATCSLAKWC